MQNESTPIEAEVVSSNQAVAIRQSTAVAAAPLSVKEILDQVKLIQDVMRSVMVENEHYGTIPGCGDKKTLLQPGAQKLTMTFRLAPEYVIQEVNLERGHKEYRVICTLKSIQSGTFVGQGVGCCSSLESKYRYRGGTRKCPKCGKDTIIIGKAEYGGGWLCFGKKGGCGAKWADGAQEIESQSMERQENPDPADTFNTVLKMAKKRAYVDATITATAASDIFTQDIGDDEGGVTEEPPPPPPAKSKPAPKETKPKDPKDKDHSNSESAQEKAAKPALLAELRKLCQGFEPEIVRYFQNVPNKSNVIMLMPNEGLEDLRSAVLRTMINQWDKAFPAMELWCKEHPAKKEDAPEAWRSFPLPFGKDAGVLLGELDKKKLFGWWANYKVETEYNGEAKKPETIAKDQLFRDMLDEAGLHYEFAKKDSEPAEPPSQSEPASNDYGDDDVPF